MVSVDDPIVQSYILYSAILALKLLAVVILTARVRFTKKIFANEEDTALVTGKVKYDDPDVERVRRVHRNDLENIPAFWILGALYLFTRPEAACALFLFRVYTVCRILHTIVYVVRPVTQPMRAIVFLISYFIKCYMGIKVVLHFITAL
ncbi:microsomal glutathione S-transferase 1-like [Battus philenor]|uniref:microsomal glutathione S-transferase 1-like n=1 Tax=Battus philenor TaxID=42288 RepID=UPI0035CEA533